MHKFVVGRIAASLAVVAASAALIGIPVGADAIGAGSHTAGRSTVADVASPAVAKQAAQLAATPPMGWNSYNAYGCDNGTANMEAVAKFLHTSGLEKDGYTYVNTDGCYDDLESLGSPNTYGVTAPTAQDPEICGAVNGRLPDGELFVNQIDFPASRPCANDGLKLVGNYLHSLGLKLGVYLDASNNWNCEETPGSYGFAKQDAATLAWWGADYVKLDWGCDDDTEAPGSNAPHGYTGLDAAAGNQGFGGPTFATNPAYEIDQLHTQIKMYTALSDAIRASGRKTVISVAGAGTQSPELWGFQVGDLVRPTGDANANFTATGRKAAGSVVGIINSDAETYDALTGPGHWIDPDAMEIGNGSLTADEDRSEMSMFSEMSDPLLIATNLCPSNCGADTTPATSAQLAQDVSILGNKRVIAVDQDSLGSPAHIVGTFDGTHLVMAKPLANGDVAVTLFNESTTDAATMTTTAAAVGLQAAAGYQVQDLWSGDTQTTDGSISVTVPPTATVMYRITPVSPTGNATAGSAQQAGSATTAHGPTSAAPAARAMRAKAASTAVTKAKIPGNLTADACLNGTACVGVDAFGNAITVDPANGKVLQRLTLEKEHTLTAVSCPVGTGRCVATTRDGRVYTFRGDDKAHPAVRHFAADHGQVVTGLACATGTQCTLVDGSGRAITFDPATGKVRSPQAVDPHVYLAAVSCPTAHQCTAAGGGGNDSDTEVTFDPTTGAVNAAGVLALDEDTVNGVSAVDCPSATECVVVDGAGNAVAFDPTTGAVGTGGIFPLEGDDLPAGLGVMNAVRCGSSTSCTAVDASGKAVRFDPTTGAVLTAARTVDQKGGLVGLACPSARRCVGVDLDGRSVTFDPTGQTTSASTALIDPARTWTAHHGA